MRVNEMWFIEPGGEPLTFREVFLKSSALENIIAGEPWAVWWQQLAFYVLKQPMCDACG